MALRNAAKGVTKGSTLSTSVRLIYSSRYLSLRHSSTLRGAFFSLICDSVNNQGSPLITLTDLVSSNHTGQVSQKSPACTNHKTSSASDKHTSIPAKTKTVAQADAELRERLERMSGDGGAAGIEYEDGKPSAMKRGVRNNMFRVI